ncbi:protein FAM3C-like [Thalassophryne amazonica]|uniref:protein FAM3C-like n=1 Tax=Thalassophryne amazonica TaxID=390379 RepID=UPI001470E96E|nr:protein FAM3C-like [Thalassophryne amazonica]
MFTRRKGKVNIAGGHRTLLVVSVLVLLVMYVTFFLQPQNTFKVDWSSGFSQDASNPRRNYALESKQLAGQCLLKVDCPEDQLSFYIHSGAGNLIPPKMCLQNTVVLGAAKNNFGFGINIVIVDGRTGNVIKTDSFDMYAGEVQPLIAFLQSIEQGSVVLMASYDEPASKLTADARKLIADLGSSSIQSLNFRDSWVFVGGKGASVHNTFEKHIKNEHATNKYKDWPEMVEIQGCIPKFIP